MVSPGDRGLRGQEGLAHGPPALNLDLNGPGGPWSPAVTPEVGFHPGSRWFLVFLHSWASGKTSSSFMLWAIIILTRATPFRDYSVPGHILTQNRSYSYHLYI